MRGRWALVAVGAILAARVLGLFTVGFVTTGSMEPTMPPGTIFVAVRAAPDEGDVVVYEDPNGQLVVHRVVAVTPEGLVTRGDANTRVDQELGVPYLSPREVSVVPGTGDALAVVKAQWVKPLGLALLQIVLLTIGLHGLAREGARRRHARKRSILGKVRPHHIYLVVAVFLLAAAPFLVKQMDSTGSVVLSAALVPTAVRVEHAGGVEYATVSPLGEATVVTDPGPVRISRAPAMPGALALSEFGPIAAMIPAVVLLLGAAAAARAGGY